MPFSVGDTVKPKPGFDRRINSPVMNCHPYPSGEVTKVEPHGQGQRVFVGRDVTPYPGGVFEKVEVGA